MERIPLTNEAFEGANNAYLLVEDRVALVDTGDPSARTRTELERGLEAHGVSLADVDLVLLTHWHHDHSGLAAAVQAAGGATVHVHAADAPLVAGEAEAWASFRERQREQFEDWGMPPEGRESLFDHFEAMRAETDYPHVEAFEDGEAFDLGGRTIEAVHAPGHTAGLACFVDGDEAFTGDALLPKYTPNVGGADVRVERPLERYLGTLVGIVAAGYDRAWPGHRDPIDDPTARARDIIAHHEERARRVLDVLRGRGPADAWTVSAALFGDLEGIHVMHGPGEAFAHLDHLDRRGDVERTPEGYLLAEDTRARLEDTEGWPLVERAAGDPVAVL